jgi:hypothetical protein
MRPKSSCARAGILDPATRSVDRRPARSLTGDRCADLALSPRRDGSTFGRR